jgi:hypothetical protein
MLPHQSHSNTSLQAAIAFAEKAPQARLKVYALLSQVPQGLTDEEIQTYLAMGANTQRPRRIELTQEGLVQDTGRTRCTASGQDAVVWAVTGKSYPETWSSKKDISSELSGRAKAIAEIKAAIPVKKRSPELVELLQELEQSSTSLNDDGDWLVDFVAG